MAHIDLDEWYDEPEPDWRESKLYAEWECRMGLEPEPRWPLSDFRIARNLQPHLHERIHAEDELLFALQSYKLRRSLN